MRGNKFMIIAITIQCNNIYFKSNIGSEFVYFGTLQIVSIQ